MISEYKQVGWGDVEIVEMSTMEGLHTPYTSFMRIILTNTLDEDNKEFEFKINETSETTNYLILYYRKCCIVIDKTCDFVNVIYNDRNNPPKLLYNEDGLKTKFPRGIVEIIADAKKAIDLNLDEHIPFVKPFVKN